MKNNIVYNTILIIFIFFVQELWMKVSPLFQVVYWKPDLLMLILFLVAQVDGRRYGLLFGIYMGVLSDFSTEFFGFGLLAYSLSGFVAGQYFEFDEQYNQVNFIWGLLTSTFVANLIWKGLYFYGKQPFWETLFKYVLPISIYTVIVGLFLYFLIEKWIKYYYVSRKSA
jgi:rod shape-determining protein MreD